MRDEVEDVEPGDALRLEQARRIRFGLLQDRRQHVAGIHLGALRALDVQHRRLQHAPERGRLFRLALLAAAQLFHRAFEILIELSPQAHQVGARALQNPFAFRVMGERVQQVLEREVRVPPRYGLAVGDRQDDFDRCGKHLQVPVPIIECDSGGARHRRASGPLLS